MDLYEPFAIYHDRPNLVSFVGGGGKTSTIMRLANELKHAGQRVLVTTTTAMWVPSDPQYNNFLLQKDYNAVSFGNSSPASITVLGGDLGGEKNRKLMGITPILVDLIYQMRHFDTILVEADGSRGLPIKAPAIHEPVVPSLSSVVIGVIGFDCYERSLDKNWVHRPEILANITGKGIGDMIDRQVFCRLAAHKDGLFKNAPSNSQKILFFNKATRESWIILKDVSEMILTNVSLVSQVVIGAIQLKDVLMVVTRGKTSG